ncbi:MAG TPA: hypothetical protein VFZ27_14065 [Terriglobia bacterium]|nr:hypothetical protein [Terriglobia bacterium]
MDTRMKKAVLFGLATLLVGSLSFLVSRVAHVQKLRAESSARRPFTAVIVEHRHPGDASISAAAWPNTQMTMYAVRSDGSTAEVIRRVDPNNNPVEIRVVVDMASARRVSIDPMTQSVTTYPLSQASLSFMNGLAIGCQSATSEHSTLIGYDVVKVQDSKEWPDGTADYSESWQAPALGCLRMDESSSPQAAANRTVWNTREVTFVAEGEPSAALFAIPSDYVERSPSEVFAEFQRRFPNARSTWAGKAGSALDPAYNQGRAGQ